MNPETQKKIDDMRQLINTLPEEFGNFKDQAEEIVSEISKDIDDLNGDLEDTEEELAILKSKIDDLTDEVNFGERKLEECKSWQRQTEEDLEELENSFVKPENLQDELRNDVCRRLYNNLTLEQLENVEHTVKQGFKNVNREYILELN